MKILDFSTLLPGPEATKILLEEGHEVIKIENINFPDTLKLMKPTQEGIGVIYKNLNNNKAIKQFDFRNENDIAQIIELVKGTDVIIENMRPGRMSKLGLGYESLKAHNEKLIYVSITGYPKDHAWAKKAAHDLNVLAVSGYFEYASRYSQQLNIPPIQIADIATSFYTAIKVLSQKLKNEGAHINVSMIAAIKHYFEVLSPLGNYEPVEAEQNFPLWGTCLCYNLYKTADNKYVALAAFEGPLWQDFCSENELVNLVDKQFSSDKNDMATIESFFSSKPLEYFTAQDNDYCLTPVLSFKQAKEKGLYA